MIYKLVTRVIQYLCFVLFFVFLTAIWLPCSQLWATIEGQPHSPDVITVFCIFGLNATGSLVARLGP